MANDKSALDAEALAFHENGRPGKLEITPTKPLASQRDLSLRPPSFASKLLHFSLVERWKGGEVWPESAS